jgi:hypothetical protein
MWHPSVLASGTITQKAKITKSAERSLHDRTNTIQRDRAGYTISNHFDLHKRSCVEWLVM